MNVIIIDNSKRSMQIMRRFPRQGNSDVAVTEYDPDQRGTPPHAFDWAEYDTLLLSQDLGAAGTGLQWLEDYGSSANFPPTIIVAQKDDPQLTSNALKLGAHSVITKRDLTPDNLAGLVQEASVAEPVKREGAGDRKDNSADAEIVAQAQGPEGEGYKITRLIGQGAMSRVYLADRLADKQTVVLKIMDGTLTNDNEVVKRFILEATLVSELESPHVVKVYDQGFTDKYGYMAMEFFSRGDLKQRIELGISFEHAVDYLLHIGYGLEAIHDVGIIHRDLKPANIMFRGDDHLAIADFGISKRMDSTSELTAVGSLMGTPYYMSPEQVRTEPADHRSDLYAAGIIFYEMLTGEKPYTADSLTGIALKHINEAAPDLPVQLRHVDPIFKRLVAKLPAERYQSAAELIEDLKVLPF